MNTYTVVLGVLLAAAGARGTFSDDDQSYSKSKRGLTVVPAPSLAPAAGLSPYFGVAGVARAAYLPYAPAAAPVLPRPGTAYYAGSPVAAYPAPAVPGYSVPAYAAPTVPGYSVAAYPAPAPAIPGYSTSAYPAPAPAAVPAAGPGVAYPAAPVAALARAPHLAYSYYG